jgi:hypothetical protein
MQEVFDFRSDREIACILRLSCKDIESITTGHEFPPAETMLLVKKATGVSLHWLLTGEGPIFPPPAMSVSHAYEMEVVGLA